MSGNREPTSDLPEPSDVRFGMRGLLLTMTAVAVVTAVLGSTVRRLDSNALANVMPRGLLCLDESSFGAVGWQNIVYAFSAGRCV